jgi:UDP-N-acetylmuramyl-tripeptide synthetase
VTCDSRAAGPGTLFVCKGAAFKLEYLQQAVERGAIAYISEFPHPQLSTVNCQLSIVIVSDVRAAMSALGAWFYAGAREAFRLTGITGTKGKSTTAYFIKFILDDYLAGEKRPESAILSTIETYDGLRRSPAALTTPEPLDLHAHFARAAEAGLPYFTMEVSSQALKTGRVAGVRFDVGCFLNFGEDHIGPSEHPDLEDYFQSKLKLLAQCETACVNLGTERVERVLEAAGQAPRVITFGLDERADIYGYDVVKAGDAVRFRVRSQQSDQAFSITIPGLFNVENALAAIAACTALEIPERYIRTGLCKARVGGRMEAYASADGAVTAIVDYAHNEMSFENLFRSVAREYPGRAVTAVFGATGGKGQTRRDGLGEVAGRYARDVILTEDDPGPESVADICRDIAARVGQTPCRIIEDRGAAIETAISGAAPGTVVVIAGKGHEGSQRRGTERVPCLSDAAHARRALKAYDIAHKLDPGELADTLARVLPSLRALRGQTAVIDPGGAVLEDPALLDALCADIALLRAVGARVAAAVSPERVPGLLNALKRQEETAVDATDADLRMLELILNTGATPVLGTPDPAALAASLNADRLVCLRDSAGLVLDPRNPATRMARAEPDWLAELLDGGFTPDPALPDLRACLQAIEKGVKRVSLLDGRAAHAIMTDALLPRVEGTVILTGGHINDRDKGNP